MTIQTVFEILTVAAIWQVFLVVAVTNYDKAKAAIKNKLNKWYAISVYGTAWEVE